MTEVHERQITSAELHHIIITCPTCATEITLDAKNKEQVSLVEKGNAPPCPVCGVPPDSAVATAVRDFLLWYRDLHRSGKTVSFRLAVTAGVDVRKSTAEQNVSDEGRS